MAACKYRWRQELGSGAFGHVIWAEDKVTHEHVAVKKLPRHLAVDVHMERELLAHSRLQHPNIVQFYEVFVSPNSINLVMEYVPDGTLLGHVRQRALQGPGALPEDQARWLFQQLVLAVDYCHQMGVSNRDIKLDNILLDKSIKGSPDKPILKMCDWGYARSGSTSEATSRVGTLYYMAPEVLQNRAYSTRKADIWSCGVVLYAMLCGRMPFTVVPDLPLAEQFQLLAGSMLQRNFQIPPELSPGVHDLLTQLLQPDPAARIDVAGILAHPWFTQGLRDDALTMNTGLLQQPRACAQSEEEILDMMMRARNRASTLDTNTLLH